jgi:hypothetical protein
VPEVYWDWCRVDVMVMERIRGVPISDMQVLRDAGTNIRLLAENGVKIFFTQVFRHNFFHADMHPGNIFVMIDDPAKPRYAAVDFGIVGTLDPRDQHYLAENFLAFFDRDYRRVAVLHVESGWVPPDTRVDEMESAVRTVLRADLQQAAEGHLLRPILLRLFEISRRFDMKIQPQLILLQKTLLNIEGLGRDLYPDLDIWQTARRSCASGWASASAARPPKGVLLLGVQGCGKSLAAKAVAGGFGVPLLRLDFGALYNKYHGETERNLREACAAPSRWRPACCGSTRSRRAWPRRQRRRRRVAARARLPADLDGRAQGAVFLVATANDVDELPPELLRKGRFDEIFFVDLPAPRCARCAPGRRSAPCRRTDSPRQRPPAAAQSR